MGLPTLRPASGGQSLLPAAEDAALTVSGVIRAPVSLDRNGWAARLEVERVLSGPLEAPASLGIAWEELVPGRPARFSEGGRVVVALKPLPGASLWQSRFPEGDVWVVAAAGEAFLRAPDPATLDALAARLAVPQAERSGEAGVETLSLLVARAQPPLADAALHGLGQVPDLASRLGEAGRLALEGALADTERPLRLRRELLELIGSRQLAALGPAVTQQARVGSPLEAAAWRARAELEGGLQAAQVEALLEREEPALRQVAVAQASSSPVVQTKLPSLISGDPDADVRAVAVESWLRLRGVAGLPEAEPALFDRERRVRGRAARAVGQLGAEVVPRLRELVAGSSADRALGPIAALRQAGPAGRSALREIAASHEDQQVRTLARLALGEEIRRH